MLKHEIHEAFRYVSAAKCGPRIIAVNQADLEGQMIVE